MVSCTLLLLIVPIALVVEIISTATNLSGLEWINAISYSLLCLAAGILLWRGKAIGYWLSVIAFGLVSVTLEVGDTLIAAAHFLPNFIFKIGSTGIDPPIYIGFSWIPFAIFLYLLVSGKKAFGDKYGMSN